jgi:hypothetical protein
MYFKVGAPFEAIFGICEIHDNVLILQFSKVMVKSDDALKLAGKII